MSAVCVVCGSTKDVRRSPRDRNAIPADVPVCAECEAATGRREVGIVRKKDGTLHITDGRRDD